MMLRIPGLLDASGVAVIRGIIDSAEWTDGNVTSGRQAAQAKRNMQLPEKSAAARQAGDLIMAALERSGRFFSGALPLKIYPPLFNRYEGGMTFGTLLTLFVLPTVYTLLTRPRHLLPAPAGAGGGVPAGVHQQMRRGPDSP